MPLATLNCPVTDMPEPVCGREDAHAEVAQKYIRLGDVDELVAALSEGAPALAHAAQRVDFPWHLVEGFRRVLHYAERIRREVDKAHETLNGVPS